MTDGQITEALSTTKKSQPEKASFQTSSDSAPALESSSDEDMPDAGPASSIKPD